MSKDVGDEGGTKSRSMGSMKPVNDAPGTRFRLDDPIEFLTGIFQDQPTSLAAELLEDRNKDDEIDEASSSDS